MINVDKLRMKYQHKVDKKFKAAEIADYLFGDDGLKLKPLVLTAKTKKPSTSEAALNEYKTHPKAGKFIKATIEQAKCDKIVSTYIVGFRKHLKQDGRFHPSYVQSHTTTGRLNASSPAMLTLPKHADHAKTLRRAYVPPDGHVIVGVDFDAGELKIMSNIADVKKMKAVFRAGEDIHLTTGLSMAGKDSGLTETEIRQRGKSAKGLTACAN